MLSNFNLRMTRTYSCRFLRSGNGVAHLSSSGGAKWGQRTRRSMGLMVKFGLVRLQHADFPPSVEEQGNGSYPYHEHQDHAQHLFDTDYHHWSVWKKIINFCLIIIKKNKTQFYTGAFIINGASIRDRSFPV